MPLFREEAVDAHLEKLHGDVFIVQPLTFSVLTVFTLLLVAVSVTLLLAGSYARTERVSGYLEPSTGLANIRARRFGYIEAIHVDEGDMVSVGDTLAVINVDQAFTLGRSSSQQHLRSLEEQRLNLEHQIALEENQLNSELKRIALEQQSNQLEIISLQHQVRLLSTIAASSEKALKSIEAIVEKGYVSKADYERRYQQWLNHQAQVTLAEQKLVTAKANKEQLEIRLRQLPDETERRSSRLAANILELDHQQINLQGEHAYVINAPVSGQVVSVLEHAIGQSVQKGKRLLTLLPARSELHATLFIPSRAAGFIKPGQEVRLLYHAFPYQRFGSFPATITAVTRTILAPNEATPLFDFDEPVYRVTAKLENDRIDVSGETFALQSGMQLEANIIIERRSFIDWLFHPLRTVSRRT